MRGKGEWRKGARGKRRVKGREGERGRKNWRKEKTAEQDIELLVLMIGPLLPLGPPLCGRSLELEKDFVPPRVTSL